LIEKSLRLDDKNAAAYKNLATYYTQKGDKAKAKQNEDLALKFE
jgi:Tfp pilus assembly protein PilF